MALIVSGNIELSNGLSVDSCYARTNYRVNDSSSQVVIMVEYWLNKDAYETGKLSIPVNINTNPRVPYNRDVDGSDVLDFTQIKVKEQLEDLGYSVVITEL